jgi:hypothetical protein
MTLREEIEAVINILVEDTIDREKLHTCVALVLNYKELLEKSKKLAVQRLFHLMDKK